MRTITVRMPDELHRKLKVRMAEEERTIQNHIIDLVSDDLDKRVKKSKWSIRYGKLYMAILLAL